MESPSTGRLDASYSSRTKSASGPPPSLQPPEAAKHITADLSNYLALGSLCFEDILSSQIDDDLEPGSWQDIWFWPSLSRDTSVSSAALSKLMTAGWVRVQASRCVSRPRWMIFRIHLLFHDVGLRWIDRSSKQLSSALEQLIQKVNVDPGMWEGNYRPDHCASFQIWATREEGNPSLFRLFNAIPSPKAHIPDVEERYTREALEDLVHYDIPGLCTRLYPYQRRSAAAMMHRESTTKVDLDFRLEQRVAADGCTYYYNARDVQFLRNPQYQQACRGGILAESMGLGKTLICLALILATKSLPPRIPTEYADIPIRPTVNTLTQMAISCINRNSIPWRIEFDRLRMQGIHMSSCEEILKRHPPSYEVPHIPLRWNRKTSQRPPQRLIVATTTLLVVPPNLLRQWVSEIDKHVDTGCLKLLVLDDRHKLLPPANELRTYDIVLFTRTRFDMEVQDGQDSEGRRMSSQVPLVCTCPYRGATRQRMCNCLHEKDLYSSPLKQIHFKRLIVDEGHFFSTSRNTSSFVVANTLVRADHRWVVSGTPAKDLLGAEVQLDTFGDYREGFDSHDRVGAVESLTALASNFLNSTPWSAREAKNYIYRHESFREKTYSGFSLAFRRMLESVVIKTQPEDVMQDIKLPPLTHEVVLLPPSYYDKLTANLFTLLLTANAVTSERTDADYLFHKSSAKSLIQLIGNLRQSAFFWSGLSEADVHATIENSTKYLQKADTKCTPEDRHLLSQAVDCAKEALTSQGWKSMSQSHELGVFIDDWPEKSAEHWSFAGVDPVLTGIGPLLDAQEFVNSRAAEDDPGEGLAGAGIRALSSARNQKQQKSEPEKAAVFTPSKVDRPILNKAGIPTSALEREPSKRRASAVGSPVKSESPRGVKRRRTGKAGRSSLPHATDSASNAATRDQSASQDEATETHLNFNPYAWTKIVGTASSKLSYLLSQVLEHCYHEKILIFYQGENAAYWIGQFLELFKIKHEIYAKSLSADKKAQYVANFQEKEELRVLLMDVGQAAFGLNICAASRVYFVNPICRPHLEAQAIKRAHRIGQTRKVTVETLVLQDSIEEKMLERSKHMTRAEHQNAKVLEDDGGIRAILQSATVLPLTEEEQKPGFGQMAPLGKPERLWYRPGWQQGSTTASPKRRRQVKRVVLEDKINSDYEEIVIETPGIPLCSFSLPR